MPKGIYKRKKNRGKYKKSLKEAIITASTKGLNVGDKVTFNYTNPKGWKPQKFTAMETVNLEPAPSRLDVLMSELETEFQRIIAKMKGMI